MKHIDKCNSCNYVGINKDKKQKTNLSKKLYYLCTLHKQTYTELYKNYGLYKKKIQSLFVSLNILSTNIENLPNTTNGIESLF